MGHPAQTRELWVRNPHLLPPPLSGLLLLHKLASMFINIATVNSRYNESIGTSILVCHKQSFVITEVICLNKATSDQKNL